MRALYIENVVESCKNCVLFSLLLLLFFELFSFFLSALKFCLTLFLLLSLFFRSQNSSKEIVSQQSISPILAHSVPDEVQL